MAMYVNSYGKTVYAEDIDCILPGSNGRGGIFIGNL